VWVRVDKYECEKDAQQRCTSSPRPSRNAHVGVGNFDEKQDRVKRVALSVGL